MSIDKVAKPRVLIVEDEPMIALDLEDLLRDAGFVIVGVAANLANAIAMIESVPFDVAVLDANLGGISAAPAARLLTKRSLPFVIVSGYSEPQQPRDMSQVQTFSKPVDVPKLIAALNSIYAGSNRNLCD